MKTLRQALKFRPLAIAFWLGIAVWVVMISGAFWFPSEEPQNLSQIHHLTDLLKDPEFAEYHGDQFRHVWEEKVSNKIYHTAEMTIDENSEGNEYYHEFRYEFIYSYLSTGDGECCTGFYGIRFGVYFGAWNDGEQPTMDFYLMIGEIFYPSYG